MLLMLKLSGSSPSDIKIPWCLSPACRASLPFCPLCASRLPVSTKCPPPSQPGAGWRGEAPWRSGTTSTSDGASFGDFPLFFLYAEAGGNGEAEPPAGGWKPCNRLPNDREAGYLAAWFKASPKPVLTSVDSSN